MGAFALSPSPAERHSPRLEPCAAARFLAQSANRKLSPQQFTTYRGRLYQIPVAPFCSSTYVSVRATCPETCAFKRRGCYVDGGYTRRVSQQMDRAAETRSAVEVIQEEAALIDSAFGGRDVPHDGMGGARSLRLHVGGDAGNEEGARILAACAERWRRRGGGAVWCYTHLWRDVSRAAWGETISVHASIERFAEVEEARRQGYEHCVIVTARFREEQRGGVLPCPAERGGTTCVVCRRCLDRLPSDGAVTAFVVHGTQAAAATRVLAELTGRQGTLFGGSR